MNKEELSLVNGGANVMLIGGIIGIFTFLVGVIDGYLRPLKCR